MLTTKTLLNKIKEAPHETFYHKHISAETGNSGTIKAAERRHAQRPAEIHRGHAVRRTGIGELYSVEDGGLPERGHPQEKRLFHLT